MSKIDPVTENPNDKLPDGKPLEPNRIVSEEDAGSHAIDKERQDERDENVINDEYEGVDNDLMNVGKFIDGSVENNGLGPRNEYEDKPGLPGDSHVQSTQDAGTRS